jgi:hypothetical protein
MFLLALLLLLSLPSAASAQTMNSCQRALAGLKGLFAMMPDSAAAFTNVYTTLCLQYVMDTAGTGITFPIWIMGYKSHMAVNAMLGNVQMGFTTVMNAQILLATTDLLAQANSACSPPERKQGAEEYEAQVAAFHAKLTEEQEAFVQRFPFYTNSTFFGGAFALSNQLLAYGQNVTLQISA